MGTVVYCLCVSVGEMISFLFACLVKHCMTPLLTSILDQMLAESWGWLIFVRVNHGLTVWLPIDCIVDVDEALGFSMGWAAWVCWSLCMGQV